MNDCNRSPDEPIEQRRFADIWPADDCDVARAWCCVLALHDYRRGAPRSSGDLGVGVPLGLQLLHAVSHIDDAGNEREQAGGADDINKRKKVQL